MQLYSSVIAFHVIVAVLGLGQVTALAVSAPAFARSPGTDHLALLRKLSRGISISLVLLLASGVAMTALARGAFAEAWWFRGSFALLLVVGFLNGQVARTLRRAGTSAEIAAPALGRVRSLVWGMCGLVAVIVTLMQVKPG